MKKLTIKTLNDWFENLDEKNKMIVLLSTDIDIDELNEMDIDELKSEIALPYDVSLEMEWSHINNIDKLYSYLEFNKIKYNINHILDFIDDYDDFFSSLKESDITFFMSTYTNISTKELKEWNISKEKLINMLHCSFRLFINSW